jgi:hypothetical protein
MIEFDGLIARGFVHGAETGGFDGWVFVRWDGRVAPCRFDGRVSVSWFGGRVPAAGTRLRDSRLRDPRSLPPVTIKHADRERVLVREKATTTYYFLPRLVVVW